VSVAKDWDAVARAIDGRIRERGLTQAELAASAHVSLETVRELRSNLRPRRRHPRVLAAVSEALGWPTDHLASVLEGESGASPAGGQSADEMRSEIARLGQEVKSLAGRLETVERRLDAS
jgi:transcriptional regulator with XRE-family HTH domain